MSVLAAVAAEMESIALGTLMPVLMAFRADENERDPAGGSAGVGLGK